MSLSSFSNVVMAEAENEYDDIQLFSTTYSLDDLKEMLPAGTYWNHKGTSYNDYKKDKNKYNLQSTKKACNHSEFGSTHCSQYGYSGECGCNAYSGSTQCMAFARFICNKLYGKTPNGDGSEGNGWYKTTIDNLEVGDYIRYKRNKDHYGHSVVVVSVSDKKVTVGECNHDGKCGISWSRKISKSTLEDYYSVKCLTTNALSKPTITSCDAKSDTSVEIKWNKVSGAEKYKIVRHENSGENQKTITSDCKSTSYTDKGLKSGHTYYYVVYAGKDKKWSDASKEYKTYTKPSTPEVKVNRDSTSSLTLSWNKVSGADHYIVKYRKCKAGTTKPDYETLGTVKGTSYTHKNLSKGTQYCYRVIAVKEGNLGEAGAKKQKQVKSDYKTKSGFTLFDRPKNELDNDGNVVLSWGKASGDNTYAYRIERTTASNQYTDLGKTTSLTYTDKTAPAGEICKYKITALKSDDSYKTATTIGEFYAGAKVQTKITLTPQNATTMRISWSNVKSAVNVKYVVRKYVNNAWVDVATTTNTYYDDKNLTAGNSYKYYVQVRDGSNNYLTSTFSASTVLEILPTKISLDKTAITLTEGESANLTYTISPNNVTNKNVTWTSSNSSVATVSGGTVKAISEGTANITVTTTNGKSAQCSVTVKSKKCSHQYGEWITEATANCETDGSRYRTCNKCGEKETETIPALGHSYSSEWTVITPESCTENGEMAHICLTCGGKTDITPIPATEHQFNDEWLTEKSATCLDEGIEYRQCANCDVKETRTTEKTTHNYVLTDEIDMTQDAPGYKTYTCSICNDSYTEEYVPEINAGIIEIGSGAPQAGGTVTLPVTISQNPGIAGFLFTLNYDKTALVPKTITKGEILTAGTFTSNLEQGIPAEQLSEISVYWENDKNMTSNGVLFNITFEVKASAEEGEYPVSLNYEKGDITDETMDDVMPDLLGNTVTIADVLRGDVNLDRQVNILDSILLSRYIAKWDVTFDEKQKQAANVFMDSRINSKDGVRLSQILSGYDITESVALLSTNEINLEVGNVEASGGEYVSVPVTISENEGIAGFNFKIEYDKNVLTPVSVTKGDALLDGSFMTNLTEDTDGPELDYVTAYWNNSYNVTDNGELFNVEFLVNENAEIGNTLPITLTYEADDLCDNNLNDVTGNITNGSVTVTSSNATVEADGDISLGYVITDLTMQSETGVTYEDIPQKGDFDLIAEIDGIYSEINDILPSKFIVALYDENDMFIKLETKDITEQMITDGKVEISVGKTSKAIAKLKLFIWNSLDSMKPLAESVIMPEIME